MAIVYADELPDMTSAERQAELEMFKNSSIKTDSRHRRRSPPTRAITGCCSCILYLLDIAYPQLCC
jgi:hypothetical protein